MNEAKSSPSIDPVAALKELDFRPLRDSELSVKTSDFRIFGSDPSIGRDSVIVASFDHEGARRHQGCLLRVFEFVGLIEIKVVVLGGEDVGRRVKILRRP